MEVPQKFHPVIDKITKKPTMLVVIPIVYFFIVMLAKWRLALPLNALFLFMGGIIGMYILDVAEEFFHLAPSPFRTMVFSIGLYVVGFYTITSTQEIFAQGLVLSLSLTLFLYQVSEWRIRQNLDSWYQMLFGSVSLSVQKIGLGVSAVAFFLETVFFMVH